VLLATQVLAFFPALNRRCIVNPPPSRGVDFVFLCFRWGLQGLSYLLRVPLFLPYLLFFSRVLPFPPFCVPLRCGSLVPLRPPPRPKLFPDLLEFFCQFFWILCLVGSSSFLFNHWWFPPLFFASLGHGCLGRAVFLPYPAMGLPL